MSVKELALRWALSDEVPHVALIGLSGPEQVNEIALLAGRGPLLPEFARKFDLVE